MQLHPHTSQVLVVNHGEEKKVEMTEEGLKREAERGTPTSLLRGEYDEEESARSFQEALRQWRGERSNGAGEPMREETMWIPVRPVSVSATATQADLPPDREAEGRASGGGQGRVHIRVEFTENSLTYMDRLLLKKHRRTPVETYDTSWAFGPDLKSLPTNTEEETPSSLTAQEEDFRRYCASLFAVPVSGGRSEAQITTPEPCLVIEVLDETVRDINGIFVAEQRTNSRKVPLSQNNSNRRTPVPQTALTSGGSSRVSRSSPSPKQLSGQSRAPAQPKTAQKLHSSKLQTSQAGHSMKPLPSKSISSACPTAETPRTSQTSIKTPTSKSQKPHTSPTVHKSKAVKMAKEEELPVDSGDEMSSDSLGPALHEEGSSDEEAWMHGHFTRGRSREEEQGNSAISHLRDSFVPTDAEGERDLWTDEPEQLSETSMVMHSQSAGSGSEQFCDLDGFSPLGLDLNSGHFDTPEHTHCGPLRTCQTSPHDSDPTDHDIMLGTREIISAQ
ncbi:zinc finger B-box domain-containing protein 1 isoform X1 [Lates japonicus]|uniref:Zinc finger B-box domain-containing protein 1 isoform X1 n=1 Tax=Lates japonicus TaxID=270547 RepID=A0AAD3MNX4_LATJO|nr:zinc finger B-box domain-containing protein 1 isoform X1 [Lates japonicus]